MESLSPIFAALGVMEFDALNDLARWLDGSAEPMTSAGTFGWRDLAGDPSTGAASLSAGGEG